VSLLLQLAPYNISVTATSATVIATAAASTTTATTTTAAAADAATTNYDHYKLLPLPQLTSQPFPLLLQLQSLQSLQLLAKPK